MANTVYANFYLSNEIEDQFTSHLNLQQFFKVDDSLQGEAGMVRKINVYSATDGTEILSLGAGNTKSIEVDLNQKTYTIQTAQNRFKYYDEQALADPMLVPAGAQHMATDMFNTVNADIYSELKGATLIAYASAFNFDAFVDAIAKLNIENIENAVLYGFAAPSDVAAIRKSLVGSLQYVEAFARTGYIGTVAGVNLYTKKDATAGTIVIAAPDALTLFNKKGIEVEQERNANTRENSIYSRKYYIAALTDATKAVKIVKGLEPAKISNVTLGTPTQGTATDALTIEYTATPASSATLAYQWQIGNSANGTFEDIATATSATYTPAAGDVGKFIRVSVTASGSATGTVISNAKKVVAAA